MLCYLILEDNWTKTFKQHGLSPLAGSLPGFGAATLDNWQENAVFCPHCWPQF